VRVALAVGMTGVVAATAVGSAQASDEFGRHVAICAQSMGFSADHNPGMHHGYAGWSPDHTC
jgi:hypothetical protein